MTDRVNNTVSLPPVGKPPHVQVFNPVTRRWVLLDTKTGEIVGAQAMRYEGVPER